MKIKFILSTISLIMTVLTYGQQKNRYHNDKIEWTISFPESFKDMNFNKQPVQIVVAENTTEQKPKISNKKNEIEEITYQGSKYNFFYTIIENNKENIDLKKKAEDQNKSLIEALKVSNPKTKFETKYSTEKIDNVNFYKSELTMDLGNSISQHFIIYFAKIKNYYANFSIVYANENDETKEIIAAFKNSKFAK
ncbi:hypothetical protein GCM10010992_00990 [Cloacibacterium rupense]|uniref:PsbP C-terminal domain-containing protein n=1 Tax=Cloacibacterium rupense TaxID=517423 RepID=A0ABQ2NEE0_9FLAO|nr:hypothetical protein [Cloacibacterium rupense]GGP01233.1 hypothetical protein GCM10010992_00990 [Cloacibacterium rupense]